LTINVSYLLILWSSGFWSDEEDTIKSHKASMLVKCSQKYIRLHVFDLSPTYFMTPTCCNLFWVREFIKKHIKSVYLVIFTLKSDLLPAGVNIETNKIHNSIDITIQVISMNINNIIFVCVYDYMVTKPGLVTLYMLAFSQHQLSETDKLK